MKRNTSVNKAALNTAKDTFECTRKKECQNFIIKKTQNLNVAQTRKFWQQFKKMFKPKAINKVEPLKQHDGTIITDNIEVEEVLFSTFFCGQHLDEKGGEFDDYFFDTVNGIYDKIINEDNHETSSHDTDINSPITIEEIKSTIRDYSTEGKSFDNNELHPTMLKNLGPIAINKLCKLYNSCLDTGEWVWDTAEVIFLRKDGKKSYDQPGSYRPISISSYVGKVLEKLLSNRLEKYLFTVNCQDSKQEGFSKKRNTVRYLNRLDSQIRHSSSRRLTTICLFLDFEKAFASVWKKGLMIKLGQIGITGKVWNMINSFLFNRKVQLKFNNYVGVIRSCLEFGLPQGSALSPMLFKFFIYDLAADIDERTDVDLFKFADDGTIQVTGSSTKTCLETLELVCDSLNIWCNTWRIIINCDPGKTELICFSTAENDTSLLPDSVMIGSSRVLFVNQTKVLGLIIDKDLSYKEHGKSIHQKMLARWVDICKCTNRNWGFKQHVLVKLIETLISTCIQYAGFVWINHHSIKEVEKLWYKMIKSTIGAVFNVKQSTGEIILGIPPITVSSKIHSIKHHLKLNIFQIPEDPLSTHIKDHTYS